VLISICKDKQRVYGSPAEQNPTVVVGERCHCRQRKSRSRIMKDINMSYISIHVGGKKA